MGTAGVIAAMKGVLVWDSSAGSYWKLSRPWSFTLGSLGVVAVFASYAWSYLVIAGLRTCKLAEVSHVAAT